MKHYKSLLLGRSLLAFTFSSCAKEDLILPKEEKPPATFAPSTMLLKLDQEMTTPPIDPQEHKTIGKEEETIEG